MTGITAWPASGGGGAGEQWMQVVCVAYIAKWSVRTSPAQMGPLKLAYVTFTNLCHHRAVTVEEAIGDVRRSAAVAGAAAANTERNTASIIQNTPRILRLLEKLQPHLLRLIWTGGTRTRDPRLIRPML